jgi:hypothetical protein
MGLLLLLAERLLGRGDDHRDEDAHPEVVVTHLVRWGWWWVALAQVTWCRSPSARGKQVSRFL